MNKWSVQVTVGGADFSDVATEKAARVQSDTLAVVRSAGLQVAREALKEEFGDDASVIVFKQLKDDPAPVRDRSYYLWQDELTRQQPDGIRVQYNGH